MKVIVSGQVGNALHQGGAAWVVLQYVLGLRRLGHTVFFIEPLETGNLQSSGAALVASSNGKYFSETMKQFGLEDCSSLIRLATGESVGMSLAAVKRVCGEADVLLNLSGVLREPTLMERVPVRAYVDIDPGFTQLWYSEQNIDMGFAGHTHFLTIGESIGLESCEVPSCNLTWIPTRQPVMLEAWPVAGAIDRDALTTVANWRAYGSVEYRGRFYGQKAHSLRPLFSLPRLTPERFHLALAIHGDETRDLEALRQNGWCILDPLRIAECPESYRRFVQGSKAEFGVAKSGYVAGKTGWFSDRSACYLASGRPVIAQDTGFGAHIPSGEGLFQFETTDDVLGAIDELNRDYYRHSRAARSIAEQYFDSDKVLSALLDSLSERPAPEVSRAG